MLAYDYPLLGIFWSIAIFTMFATWFFVVIWCFVDNFRRHDHHGFAKAMWFIFLVFLPVIGVMAYMIARPTDADDSIR